MIGVAVSTFNRPDILARSLAAWTRHLPADAAFVLVDDGSDPPAVGSIGGTVRHPNNLGIAPTKNTGIAALMTAGVDHLFLVDDDCWPRVADWWRPYVDDPAPHLMLCWGRARRESTVAPYTYWRWPRGVMLYAHRGVIDIVGGMRREFARCGGEHVEWSRRIHNAGLTKHPFMDLVGAAAWWHCEDWGRPGESNTALGRRRKSITTIPNRERPLLADRRHALYERYRGSSDFVPYGLGSASTAHPEG